VVEVAAAAEQNDQLIERRTASRTKANAQAASWAASERQESGSPNSRPVVKSWGREQYGLKPPGPAH
jgi:hypothetical protein